MVFDNAILEALITGGRVPEASQHLAPALLDLATAADRHDWRSIEDVDVPLRQRHLSHSIDEASYIHLITGAPDTRSKALALSTAIPHAGDWLNVIPSHALAALAPRKEVPSLIPGTSSRPADVYLPNWMRGQPAALDVHVISTLQQLTLKEAAVTQGHALSVGEERKRAAHSEACHAVGVTFIPMVMESLGEVGVRRQLSPSRTLDGFRASDWEFPPPKPPDTFFSGWPSICGGATPPSGSAASPLDIYIYIKI